jgi:hypothetical protein
MNAASQQTNSTTDDRTARANHAFFDAEPEIRDLRHMASIAWTLFQDTIKDPDCGTGWRTVRMTDEEFECLEFAVAKTMSMAQDLDKAFNKTFEKGIGT